MRPMHLRASLACWLVLVDGSVMRILVRKLHGKTFMQILVRRLHGNTFMLILVNKLRDKTFVKILVKKLLGKTFEKILVMKMLPGKNFLQILVLKIFAPLLERLAHEGVKLSRGSLPAMLKHGGLSVSDLQYEFWRNPEVLTRSLSAFECLDLSACCQQPLFESPRERKCSASGHECG
mmetsp:Transcript_1455/g.4087  ORF Transcript_1455/g.4087 Transcript_1455/m.4087 type:complete len:178 (-) Transcript_1455:200-733(-)